MTGKIFRSILLAAVASLLAALVILTGILYDYFGGIQQKNLREAYTLTAAAVSERGIEYLQACKPENYRLTWVAADGTVLYDTSVDASTMENHADRKEIQTAIATGTGESARYSATLTEKTTYYAGLLADGTVLRLSYTQASVVVLMLGMLQPFLAVLLLLTILSIFLANRMAKHIVEPLNGLDLEHPLDNQAYDELAPLLRRINSLQGEVRQQIQRLQRKTKEFEQITGSMNEGLVLLDAQATVISINNAALQLFAADRRCIGQDFLTVDRSVAMQEAIRDAMADGHSELQVTRNGLVYQFDLSRIDAEGNAVGVILLAFDVTAQVYAVRNRREFTANVSHELKTPLQSIMGSAELMEQGLVKPADVPRFVGHIRAEAARLVTLVEDTIRLSQLDEGSQMPCADTDWYAVASEVVAQLQYAADEKNVQLQLTGASVVVRGVQSLLAEIVSNLCDNAIKYTDAGGHVTVSVCARGEYAVLTVSDDGIGIPPEHQSRIFERFYRVDKSHSKASGGTGLGLSIVKHAVQDHHGTIGVDSKPGKGSVFTVTLPLSWDGNASGANGQ